MKHIIRFSIKHPISILMAVISIILLGIISLMFLKADFLPVIQKRKLLVSTEYQGISAKDMKSLVTIPLEDSFGSLSGMKNIVSVSRDSLSLITIELHWGTDVDMALVECREIIDSTYEALPSRCKKPTVTALESIKEAMTVVMIPLDNDLKYGRYIADYDIKPRLQRVIGVASVSVTGGDKEQIDVIIDKEKLESKHLTLNTIANILASSNFEYPAGTIKEGERILNVKTSGTYSDIKQIANTPIVYNEGGLLRISDIGEVVDTVADKETFFLFDNKECIKLGIKKKNDASPLVLSKEIKNEIQNLQKIYGSYYSFIITNDQAEQVKSSIIMLLISAVIGSLVASLIIYYFLRSIKLSIIISSIIPICSFATLVILLITGKSLNIMSFSGLAIGIGMVIDSSAVVIENIQCKFASKKESMLSAMEIIEEAVGEVYVSNIGSTLTTIVVFIPIFFLRSIMGELFCDLSIAIISSITVSCILSITYIPAMCMFFSSSLKTEKKEIKLLKFCEAKYVRTLHYIIKRKVLAVLIVVSCLIIGIISCLFIKFELLPSLHSDVIEVDVTLPIGSTIESMQKEAALIQTDLLKDKHIFHVNVSGGIETADYEYLSSPDNVKEKLHFTIFSDGHKNNVNELFNNLRYEVSISNRTDLLSEILNIQNDYYILCAESEKELEENTKKYVEDINQIQPNVCSKEYTFIPDRLANARFAISAVSTAELAYSLLEGINTTPFYQEGREIPIRVKLRKTDIKSIDDLENCFVQLEESYIPLRLLGNIELRENEKILYRYNRKDAKMISFPKNIDDKLISLKDNDISEMLGDGVVLLIVVILLLYLIMGAQFESFVIPVLLLIALPPAFSGAFFFITVFNQSLNINSILALVVLFGTSVNNSILLYETCNLREKITDASIIIDCKNKLRSLLVTNLTSIFALIPFAIDPQKINAQSSLALAIIGGLLASLVLVLFVVPVLFSIMIKKKDKHKL